MTWCPLLGCPDMCLFDVSSLDMIEVCPFEHAPGYIRASAIFDPIIVGWLFALPVDDFCSHESSQERPNWEFPVGGRMRAWKN